MQGRRELVQLRCLISYAHFGAGSLYLPIWLLAPILSLKNLCASNTWIETMHGFDDAELQTAVEAPAPIPDTYLVILRHGGYFFFANYSKRCNGKKRKRVCRLEWRHSPFDASPFTLTDAEKIAASTPGTVAVVERNGALKAFQRGNQ